MAPLVLTAMHVLQQRKPFDPKNHIISRADYVSPMTMQSEASRRLLAGLAHAFGMVLPFAEKLRAGLMFAVVDLSLLFVVVAGWAARKQKRKLELYFFVFCFFLFFVFFFFL